MDGVGPSLMTTNKHPGIPSKTQYRLYRVWLIRYHWLFKNWEVYRRDERFNYSTFNSALSHASSLQDQSSSNRKVFTDVVKRYDLNHWRGTIQRDGMNYTVEIEAYWEDEDHMPSHIY